MQTVTVPSPLRSDCLERYDSIAYGNDFTNLTLIDIGCANGYFMSRFLSSGGFLATGIEPNLEYSGDGIVRSLEQVEGHFDICFYLDLHYHSGINYFPWIKEHVRTMYISPSGSGNNKRLEEDLITEFGNFEFISNSAYANRNIYKVNIWKA